MARARTPTLGDEPIIAGALERSALRRHYPVHFRNDVQCRPLVGPRQAPSYFCQSRGGSSPSPRRGASRAGALRHPTAVVEACTRAPTRR